MKKIKISGLSIPDKESVFIERRAYKVNLGNGIVKQFLNKAEATAFLNEVSKYLSYKMHECNELYISAFTYYRRAWFYFDHNKPLSNTADLYAMERQCEYSINAISDTFKILYKRANWANGNHFVFVHFNTINNNLLDIVKVLQKLYENKSQAAILYELEILNNKIIYCKRTIENYTIELENSFKETEKISERILKIV